MGLFDIFSPWKKKFDDLIANHLNAVLAFTKNRYTVYKDMRQDHKNLFREYLVLWNKEIYDIVGSGDIETLSNDAKKYIVHNQEFILRLDSTFKKYASKKERVRNLASRFAIGNIFKQTSVSLIGTSDVNVMSEDSCNVILENYELLIEKATELDQQKKQRQKEVKDKLAKKLKARRDKIRAEQQRKEEEKRKAEEEIRKAEEARIAAELRKNIQAKEDASGHTGSSKDVNNTDISKFPYTFGAMVNELDKVKVIGLYFKYKHHGIFERVVKSQIASLVDSTMIVPSEASKIASLVKEFENEVDFFNKVKEVPDRRKKYKKLIRDKGITDQHEGIMYCLYNLSELDAIVIAKAPEPVAASKQSQKIVVPSSEFDVWKQNQEQATLLHHEK